MPDPEDLSLIKLAEALEHARDWETRVIGTAADGWQVTPGSELDLDDKLAHPYGVSAAAWSAITAAVSHLGVLRESLFKSGGPAKIDALIHTHGQLTLIRGALENASLAFWILESDSLAERITRRLQEEWEELRQVNAMHTEIGSLPAKSLSEYETELTALLTSSGGNGAQLKDRPSYGKIVKHVGTLTPVGGTATFVIWKACSSIAHGEFRGLLNYLHTSEVRSISQGTHLRQVTGNVELLCTGALTAAAMTGKAFNLYRQRAETRIR